MQYNRRIFIPAGLLLLYLVIHLIGTNPAWVEIHYSNQLFRGISNGLRWLSGSLPFSVGDVVYGIVFIWMAAGFFRLLYLTGKRRLHIQDAKNKLLAALTILLSTVILFHLLWGINYSRKGIVSQTGIPMKPYSKEELERVNGLLLHKINNCKAYLTRNLIAYPDDNRLFQSTERAYGKAESIYPFLKYRNPDIKTSLWGWLGNYWGFTGYYNPFTGEAQLNTTVPRFLLPFAACHEVAHQLGYAKEKEANFVAYLAARSDGDSLLLYSTYFDLFFYVNRNLDFVDSVSARQYRDMLSADVKNDVEELVRFNRSHRNFMEPVITGLYDLFLKSNRQPQGMRSYDEVTGLLIGYYRKYGDI